MIVAMFRKRHYGKVLSMQVQLTEENILLCDDILQYCQYHTKFSLTEFDFHKIVKIDFHIPCIIFNFLLKLFTYSLQLSQNDSFSTLGTDDTTVNMFDLTTWYIFTPVTPVISLIALSKKHLTLNTRQKEQTPPAVSSYNNTAV